MYSKRCSSPFARQRRLDFRQRPRGTATAGHGIDDQREFAHREIMPKLATSLVRLFAEWRSASISDFFSSPLGGNSAWAAARSRETSTEKNRDRDTEE